jgi:hypothetical protein
MEIQHALLDRKAKQAKDKVETEGEICRGKTTRDGNHGAAGCPLPSALDLDLGITSPGA